MAIEVRKVVLENVSDASGLETLIDEGVAAGYSVMLLDTLDDMEAARGLYGSLGFEEVPPYYYNPIAGFFAGAIPRRNP